jgi:pimeloyl-ACP methyl ester carboxylesterase
VLKVTAAQRKEALAVCLQWDRAAVPDWVEGFSITDFRDRLKQANVPAMAIHGDGDATVPFEGCGQSERVVPNDAQHGAMQAMPQRSTKLCLRFWRNNVDACWGFFRLRPASAGIASTRGDVPGVLPLR